ncbi:MAG TPA: cytochrome c [Caldilineaceae bacterium]|nr:cytochrome c [Caldilineaceae bacterium]
MWGAFVLLLGLLLAAGCVADPMQDQAKYEPYEPTTLFADNTSARMLAPNTVARGQLRVDTHLYNGLVNGSPAQEFPFPIDEAVLARGQERYTIFCAPCHGLDGQGDGMIVQRGFSPPPSFHEERLRAAPVGHYFQVITEGLGAMYGYGDRVQPEDRWAIIAYIRALQLSQNATLADVPEEQRAQLEAAEE